jgi:hypothetical protein
LVRAPRAVPPPCEHAPHRRMPQRAWRQMAAARAGHVRGPWRRAKGRKARGGVRRVGRGLRSESERTRLLLLRLGCASLAAGGAARAVRQPAVVRLVDAGALLRRRAGVSAADRRSRTRALANKGCWPRAARAYRRRRAPPRRPQASRGAARRPGGRGAARRAAQRLRKLAAAPLCRTARSRLLAGEAPHLAAGGRRVGGAHGGLLRLRAPRA